ncbi:MAG TPA: hypothetical protein VF783_07925, partial [Terriglobales bacterium]
LGSIENARKLRNGGSPGALRAALSLGTAWGGTSIGLGLEAGRADFDAVAGAGTGADDAGSASFLVSVADLAGLRAGVGIIAP